MSEQTQQEIASESLEFSFSELNSDSPVIITEQEVQASDANRKKKQRTIRQLPVFRDASNLAFVVEQLMVKCPRKYKCTLDEMERIVTSLLQSLDLANELKEDRNQLCAEAHSLIIALTVKFEIICRLGLKIVGAVVKNNRTYLSNRTLARFAERIQGFSRLMMVKELDTADCFRIQTVLNSYLGFAKGKRTYNRRKQLLQMLPPEFYKYFYIQGHYECIKTRKKYKPLKLEL